VEWLTFIRLTLVAHPALAAEQKSAIERDFRMDNGEVAITLRIALAYYFVRRHNLDLRNGEIPPERAQVFLKNFDEYQAAVNDGQEQAKLLAAGRVAATP